jgi:hypothetical protein
MAKTSSVIKTASVVQSKTKKTKAPRLTAKVTPVVEVNLVSDYCALVGGIKSAEWDYALGVASMLLAKKTIVENVKVSIAEAIEKSGKAPTIRASHAQYLITLLRMVEKYPEVKEKKLGDMLKLSQRLQSHVGAPNVEGILAGTSSFVEVEEGTPALDESRKEKKAGKEKNAKATKPVSADTLLVQFIAQFKALSGDALKVKNKKALIGAVAILRKLEQETATK